MLPFLKFLKPKLWVIIVALVGSWIPWVVNLIAKDAFKAMVRGIAGRNDVSSGAYQMLVLAASYPVSASILVVGLVVCGAAIYSAVEVKRSKQRTLPLDNGPLKRSVEGTHEEDDQGIKQPPSAPPPTKTGTLRIGYVRSDGQGRAKLTFKTDSVRPIKIKRIGPILSTERYQSEHEIDLLQNVHPQIDVNNPAECEISGIHGIKGCHSGVSLDSVLEAGGQDTSDSAAVEYADEDGNQLSLQLFLHKNQDGSIIWDGDSPNLDPKDLCALRQKLSLLRKARAELMYAGVLKLLAKEAQELDTGLREILFGPSSIVPSVPKVDLSRPMSRDVICLGPKESWPLSWERMRLMSFRDRYRAYRDRCETMTLLGSLPQIPNSLGMDDFAKALAEHGGGLARLSEGIASRYPSV